MNNFFRFWVARVASLQGLSRFGIYGSVLCSSALAVAGSMDRGVIQAEMDRISRLRSGVDVRRWIDEHRADWTRLIKDRRREMLSQTRGTPGTPEIYDLARIAQHRDEVLRSCPSEIQVWIRTGESSRKNRPFVPKEGLFTAWGKCLLGLESVWSEWLRWNDGFSAATQTVSAKKPTRDHSRVEHHKIRDIRPFLQWMDQGASRDSQGFDLACESLISWFYPAPAGIDCDQASIAALQDGYRRAQGVVRPTSWIRVFEEGAQRVIEIPTYATRDRIGWLQSVLDESWNRDPRVKIRVVSASKRASLQVFERSGVIPEAQEFDTPGRVIVMDAEADEQLNRWFMAHELGHVLGFLDGYAEIWNPTDQALVYYELDPRNIMSSLAGSVLPFHIEAILQAYPVDLTQSVSQN